MPTPGLPLYSLQGAIERAQLLVTLQRNFTRAGMDPFAAQYLGQAVSNSGANPLGGEFPIFYWCTFGTEMLILLLGVGSRAQALRIPPSYTDAKFFAIDEGAPAYFYEYAGAVRFSIPDTVTPPAKITIIGHSAGGAAAWWLSRQLFQRWNTTALTNIVTFGAPKTIIRQMSTNYNLFFHSTSCAWTLFDDPIPLLPPQSLTWTFEYGNGWLGGQLQRCQSFIGPQVGKVVQGNLSISDGTVPTGLAFPTTLDFAAWFYLFGQNPESSHTLTTYITRMVNAAALSTIAPPPPVPQPVPPAPTPATPQAVREAFAAQRSSYTAAEGRNNAVIRTYPESALFEVVKQENMWKVSFGGVIVAVGPGKKTAQGLARSGNELIRRLQGQGGVDGAGITEQFTSLIAQAQEPTSGFLPNIAPL